MRLRGVNSDRRDQVQAKWRRHRDEIDVTARAMKNSQAALPELVLAYRALEPADRWAVNELLVDWVLSPNQDLRFDALVLIREFRIVGASPALHQLAARLERSTEPGAPYESAKVKRLLEDLER